MKWPKKDQFQVNVKKKIRRFADLKHRCLLLFGPVCPNGFEQEAAEWQE